MRSYGFGERGGAQSPWDAHAPPSNGRPRAPCPPKRRTPAVLDHSRALPQSLACCAGGSGEYLLGRVFPWLLVDRKTFARCEPFSFWPHNGPSLAVLSLGHFGDRPEESEQRKTRQYCADNCDCNELRRGASSGGAHGRVGRRRITYAKDVEMTAPSWISSAE